MGEVWLMFLGLVLGFIISAVSGLFILPLLRRLHLGQHIRNDGPQTHYSKAGTPTFGGAIFLLAFTLVVVGFLCFWKFDPLVLAILLFVLAHAMVGLIDDYFNVKVNNDGLKDGQKALILAIVEAIFIIFYLYGRGEDIRILLPFSWDPIVVTGAWKIVYGLFLLFYFFACTNAVNIVDGIDGLCSSVTSVSLVFLAITAYLMHKAKVLESSYWLSILSMIMLGALLGFLIYNWHKAKCFMGDFGSLALGAMISVVFLYLEIPWAFVFAGIIYVIDIATVLIQTTYYKATGGKRIFKMTPIHHQFELEGWSEEKVVLVFSLVQLLGSLVAGALVWTSLGK